MDTEQMMKEAAAAAESAKRARDEYVVQRNSLMTQLGMSEDANLRIALDNVFSLGLTAGSTGETSLALKDALERYQVEFDRSFKLNKERADADNAHSVKHMEALQQQVVLMERVAKAIESAAEPLARVADAIEDFADEDDEEAEDAVPQPRKRPR